MEIEKLKLCPFCGGEAYRKVNNDILTVGCENCLISFANHVRFGCRADAEWNTRYDQPADSKIYTVSAEQ